MQSKGAPAVAGPFMVKFIHTPMVYFLFRARTPSTARDY
jgi:hypothetical protein